MSSVSRLLLGLAAALLALAAPLRAAPIASESFDYPEGQAVTSALTGGSGWAEGWQEYVNYAEGTDVGAYRSPRIHADNLPYAGLASSGRSLVNWHKTRAFRRLSQVQDFSTSERWISFVAVHRAPSYGTKTPADYRWELGLYRHGVSAQDGVRMFAFGRLLSGSVLDFSWGPNSSGQNGWYGTSPKSVVQDERVLVVARFTYSGGTRYASLWFNPVPGAALGSANASTDSVATAADCRFDRVFFECGPDKSAVVQIDEIRLGTTPADVLPASTTPAVVVSGPSATLAAGSTFPLAENGTHFGAATIAGGTTTRTLTLTNLGSGPLTLGAATAGGDFAVTTQPASTVAVGASTTLVVTFSPTAAGERTATLSLPTNIPGQNPFTASLAGLGNASGSVNLTTPRSWRVVQRGFATGTANLALTGTFTGVADTLQARTVPHPGVSGSALDWTTVATGLSGGVFTGTLPAVPAGGWYRLELRTLASGTPVAYAALDRVGVGEVFIFAGQSNSANAGATPTDDATGRVATLDWPLDANQNLTLTPNTAANWTTRDWRQARRFLLPGSSDDTDGAFALYGGNPWVPMAQTLSTQLGVPVGLISVGVGGTNINTWTPSGSNYARVVNALAYVGNQGARAVLWHQGESNNQDSQSSYYNQLSQMITQSSTDAAWSPAASWGVARAARLDQNSTEAALAGVIAAQTQASTALPNVFAGPYTDRLYWEYRFDNPLHFSAEGLREHGVRWADRVLARFFATGGYRDADLAYTTGGSTYYLRPDNLMPGTGTGTKFPSTATGASVSRTFTIENTGTLPMNLTGTPLVQVTGTEFTVTSQPSATTLAPGASTSFTVRFAPATTGWRRATLTVPTDVPRKTSYAVTLLGQATGTAAAAPAITSALTASGTSTTPLRYGLVASNGPLFYAATGLPAGVVLNPYDGLITGTPTASGTFNVAVSATNAAGTGTATLVLTVATGAAPVITSATTAFATLGTPFTYTLTATNSPTSTTATGLPPGLSYNPTTQTISGTPTALGTTAVALSATNPLGTGNATLTLQVSPPAAPAITSATTARATVGIGFTYTITASNNPASFSATNLPAGLVLNSATGLISGSPLSGTEGTRSVTLGATNPGGTGYATLTLTVTPGGSQPYTGTPVALPGVIEAENYDVGGPGVAYSDSDVSNNGGAYRTDQVDIQTTNEGGYNVGWTVAGEWIHYTVNVAQAGAYTFTYRVSSGAGGGSLKLSVDGVDVPGSVIVPDTVDWQSFTDVVQTGVNLSVGTHLLRVTVVAATWNFNKITVTGPVVIPTVAKPTFSPAAGTYASAQTVTIATATSGASIRYTTDGSAPTASTGTLYTGPVSATTMLKALAYKSGSTDSAVATADYVISPSPIVLDDTFADGNRTAQNPPASAAWFLRSANAPAHTTSSGGIVLTPVTNANPGYTLVGYFPASTLANGETITGSVTFSAQAFNLLAENNRSQFRLGLFNSNVIAGGTFTSDGTNTNVAAGSVAGYLINLNLKGGAGNANRDGVTTSANTLQGLLWDRRASESATTLFGGFVTQSSGTIGGTTPASTWFTAGTPQTLTLGITRLDATTATFTVRINGTLFVSYSAPYTAGMVFDTLAFQTLGEMNTPFGSALGSSQTFTRFLVTTTPAAPATPGGLGLTVDSATRLTLAWTDRASNESGFEVERSLDGLSGWTLVATPAADSTTYADLTLAPGTTYFYRVRAANSGGASAYSPVASATTHTRLQAWFASYGLPTDGLGDGAPAADPDADGVSNLLEYALGCAPTDPASAPQPTIQVSCLSPQPSFLQLTFLRARADVTYLVESSADLSAWANVTYTPVATGQVQTVSDTQDLATANPPRRFLRLRVTSP